MISQGIMPTLRISAEKYKLGGLGKVDHYSEIQSP